MDFEGRKVILDENEAEVLRPAGIVSPVELTSDVVKSLGSWIINTDKNLEHDQSQYDEIPPLEFAYFREAKDKLSKQWDLYEKMRREMNFLDFTDGYNTPQELLDLTR